MIVQIETAQGRRDCEEILTHLLSERLDGRHDEICISVPTDPIKQDGR